ncbi:MAG TPA: gamma-glutamyltransferase [Candidatus Polarisedimenticolaceae bacterium]
MRPSRTATALLAACLLVEPVLAAAARPARGVRGMVVAPEAHATEVGLAVLRSGGNAVDAAVATAFALSVTYPRAGSLGGGGFALRRGPDGAHAAIDFRETAPAALRPEMFLGAGGKFDPRLAQRSGLAVGVPGLVAGLAELHRRWGSRPWRALVAPAVDLAERGFPISEATAENLRADDTPSKLAADPAARALYLRGERPLATGDRLTQPELAGTLRRIGEEGASGFYRGPVAEDVVARVRAAAGVMTLEDLAGYRAVERAPLEGTFRGHRVITFPPPSSGGIVLLQILAMLERWPAGEAGPGSSLAIHRFAEAERRAFADRARFLGDPDAVRIPIDGLLDRAYLRSRAATIRDDRADASATLGAGRPAGAEGENTLHLSIADARGGAVAMTVTLNSWYGSGLLAPTSGVLLNNEMDDFAIAGAPNQFDLIGGAANAVAGGRRPLSSMTPTIVERAGTPAGGRPWLVLGSPGGPTIISSVAQVILNVVDHGLSPAEAVARPRVHHQAIPDRLAHEPGALPDDVAAALRRRGHVLFEREPMGNVALIALDPGDGAWLGIADPRVEGTARGY